MNIPLVDDPLLARAMRASERVGARVAWRVLRREFGTFSAIAILLRVALSRDPFRTLDPPRDRRDELTRRQAAGAIRVWRALLPMVGNARALELTRAIVTEPGVEFLRVLLGDLDRSAIELDDSDPNALEPLRGRTGRFFNAEGKLSLLATEPRTVQFEVQSCRFVPLLDALDLSALKPLFCEVDSAYFQPEHTPIRLIRDQTLAGGDRVCDFRFQWVDEDPVER